MEIDKLVTLINLELKKDNDISVNKICSKLQLKPGTVKTQLRNYGYGYNADIREYTKDIQRDNNSTKEVVEPKIEPITEVIQRDNKDIDINSLKELISLIEPIKEVIEQYNKSKTIVEVKPIELRPRAVTDVKQKLFRIDVDTLNKWDKFIAEHKEYKVQQLISLALEEFIQKYN